MTDHHPFARIEISSLEGRAQSTRLRQRLFHSLHEALRSSESTIRDAIAVDTGHNDSEITVEYALAVSELRTHYDSLNLEDDLRSQKSLENLDATTSRGIVYVVPCKQNLFYSVISAVTAALAAGNCIILELPTTLSQVSGVLRETLPSALDADIFALNSTRPSEEFLSKCYVLDQTIVDEDADDTTMKNNRVGANHLQSSPPLPTPSWPKAVAVVDRTTKVSEAAFAIGASRISFNGRSLYAPGIVLVNEFVADDFLFHLVQAIATLMYQSNPGSASSPGSHSQQQQQPQHLSEAKAPANAKAKSQSDAQAARNLKDLDEEPKSGLKVIVSGANGCIVEITDRSKMASRRQFEGRVVVICRITSLDDAVDLCNRFVTPLEASYVFASPAEANYLSRFINARISCINNIPAELLADDAARSRSRSLESWSRSVLETPLSPVKQGPGRNFGFFDQAFVLVAGSFLSVVVGAVAAAGGGAAFYGFRLTRRR